MKKPLTIAIDGPAASGKGTLARQLAKKYDLAYLDTGLLYRAVGLKFLRQDPSGKDHALAAQIATTIDIHDLADEALRGGEAGEGASVVAAIPGVRAGLLAFQKDFAANPPDHHQGAVLDGRDIGTIICPDAPIKLFVTADLPERAKRRHQELQNRGFPSIYDDVLRDLTIRDERDSQRQTAPMMKAIDAILIDTSQMDADTVLERAVSVVEEKLKQL